MRFPVTFQRQKGGTPANVPAIGTDTDPRTVGPPQVAPTPKLTNVLFTKIRDANGWPVQRIAACFTTTAANPTALNASFFLYESATGAWYLINSTPLSMTPGVLYFVDCIAVSEPSPTTSQLGKPGSPAQAGSLEVMMVVSDPGSQVNGLFTFAMGPDLTTVGT